MTTPAAGPVPYPVRVDAELDEPLSRWLWLVKWFLAIPHFVVLAFLWIAFAVLWVVAFFAILFTGRYPRAVFDFDVGVLRWSWRVSYYAFGALGTDRYPPFTLADVPDYPAHLEVQYPDHLSRGLVLVKWWLLAIPHYVVVGLFVGGGTSDTWDVGDQTVVQVGWPGLISVLVVVAAVVLAFTGAYPRAVFDFLLGMNRWGLRVAGYASLMTDAYPPFRLDMGGPDPAASVVAAPARPEAVAATAVGHRWTGGRILALVLGALLALVSAGLLLGGGAALWADQVLRDDDGYLTSPTRALSTGQYALRTERIDLGDSGPEVSWALPDRWLGTVRLRATPTTEDATVFLGIARTSDVSGYLSEAGYATITDLSRGTATYREHPGGAPESPPADQGFWVSSASGAGTQTLAWEPERGAWTVVVMNADAAPGVAVRADLAATVPALGWLSVSLLVAGVALLVVGGVVVVLAVVSASRAPTAQAFSR